MTVGLSLKKTLAQRPIISIIRCVVGDQTTSEFCPDGEIGRHKGLKIPRTKHPCRFDPGSGHHSQEDALGHLFSFMAPVNYNPHPRSRSERIWADMACCGRAWPDCPHLASSPSFGPNPIPSRLISSHPIPYNLIPSFPILSDSILLHPIHYYFIPSSTVQCSHIQSHLDLSHSSYLPDICLYSCRLCSLNPGCLNKDIFKKNWDRFSLRTDFP